jgi:DNA-binding LytR/AlgR family response regulator
MRIKCIIVDDEPLSQNVLKKYIADTPMLELLEVCSDAFEANQIIASNDIQLMFLDINMPKLSGISFAKTMTKSPLIIFTTAYPEYAIEGFEVDAIDYLVKPFSYERFLKATNKAIERINLSQLKNIVSDSFILLKSDKKVFKINYDNINYLQSFGDYIKVFTNDKCLVVHDTFKNMQEQLPVQYFQRIHKSYIVALNKIKYIDGNQIKIVEELLPIGLNFKEELLKRLNKEK